MEYLQRHPRASIFHTPGWLDALRRTYGYEPKGFTTSAPGENLANGLVFCQIDSWLTGRRLVSLPFSDHCEPLVDDREALNDFLRWLEGNSAESGWKYVEIRPEHQCDVLESSGFRVSHEYCFHTLDLRPGSEELFRRFHKSCVQRKVQRAEREKLDYEAGRSKSLVHKLYSLLLLTRRRQQLPPQPIEWFDNLADTLGDALTIRIASKDGQPVAATLALRFKDTVVYKYGCSDPKANQLGGMPFLFWRTIQEEKSRGCHVLDLGRSASDNSGLITFKNHLGATCSKLSYYSHPPSRALSASGTKEREIPRPVIACLPDPVLTLAGRVLYRHFG
jgi:GNAT acetyltransferase-like protein